MSTAAPAPRGACSDPDAEARERARREEIGAKIAAGHAILRAGNLPPRHSRREASRSGVFEPWSKKLEVVLGIARARPDAMLALIGGRGTGKTQMAVEVMRHFAYQGHQVAYYRAMEVFLHIKATYSAGTDERRALAALSTPSLLVIDEVQVRSESVWENNMLTYLLDVRYAAQRATVLICNLTPDAFAAHMGDSVMDRISETGGIVICDWPSLRSHLGEEG